MSRRFAYIEVDNVGTLLVGADAKGLYVCDWLNARHDLSRYSNCGVDAEATANAVEQLKQYLQGQRRSFTLPITPSGTAFQQLVWNALLQMPYGSTSSYAEIARRIGRPTAVRAVANAIAANPISIFIPCHRILPSNGTLGQYAGGAAAKDYLLKLEARN